MEKEQQFNNRPVKGMVSEEIIRTVFDAQREAINRNLDVQDEVVKALSKHTEQITHLVNIKPTCPSEVKDGIKETYHLLTIHHEAHKRLVWLIGGSLGIITFLATMLEIFRHFYKG